MFKSKDTDGVFMLPKKALKYAVSAKKSELKVLMYLFAGMDSFTIEKACEELSESADTIQSALSFWRGTGLIEEREDETEDAYEASENEAAVSEKSSNAKSPSERGYSTLEIADARKNDSDFSHLVDFMESLTGELLNSLKQGDLLYLYDNLGMQCDVIMGIAAHCADEGKTKIRYIVKAAEGIHNDGVRTYKELESYLAQKKSYKDYASFVKKLIGAGDRAFTPGEEKTVKKWEHEMCLSKELVEYAYERTVSLISKPSIAYMAKILESWYNDGIKNVGQAKKSVEENSSKKRKNPELSEKAKKAGFDIDLEDLFEKP